MSHFDQVIELHQNEATALQQSLQLYLRRLVYLSGQRPLYLAEVMSLRPAQRELVQLNKLLAGTWPRDRRRRLKARNYRMAFDAVLQFNALLGSGELFAVIEHRVALSSLYLKINQKALNLTEFFDL